MYWSWKQFLLLVYFELKCSLFGFFKMLRMKIRITGLQLQTARTEINNKQKKRKYFLIFNKKTSFWNKTKQGELCCGKFIFFLQHSLNPLRVFSSLFKKANFQNMQKNKICLVIFSFLNRHYKISTSRFMQIWNS